MTLEEVAGELYGLAPSEFVAARDERVRRAREDGDRALAGAIGKLRRPTVAAWAVNVLAREATDEVTALLALGDALREAQRKLSGEALRALTTQRQQVVNALTRKAGELAAAHDQKLSEATLREIGQTLHAALADPDVAAAVRTGTLTTATSYEGFGPTTLSAVPTHESPSTTGTSTRAGATRAHAADDPAHPTTGAAAPRDRAKGTGKSGSTTADGRRSAGADTGSAAGDSGGGNRPDGARGPGRAARSGGAKPGGGKSGSAARAREERRRAAEEEALAAIRQEAADALAALESARAARDSAQADRDRVTADLTAVEDRIAALRADLSHAESERRFTVAANRTAQEALNKAQRHLDHVERWAEKARARLPPH
ncbi:hypothetical protein IU501_13590 [Nocardia otitidiscaviarum]|uniref:hypothetical protein n=1 Tax=Nocardia otitidiscaviarum TaxID=1823 RepID=UPI0005BDD004|nr:hypothetical protein [Nocardia otitidiscaviarum]MBF6484311.1 hypothetical protein [Nocardia otitidiscaviarum]